MGLESVNVKLNNCFVQEPVFKGCRSAGHVGKHRANAEDHAPEEQINVAAGSTACKQGAGVEGGAD
jgi:hypothetical protein